MALPHEPSEDLDADVARFDFHAGGGDVELNAYQAFGLAVGCVVVYKYAHYVAVP